MFRIFSLVIAIIISIGILILVLGYIAQPQYKNSINFSIDENVSSIWNELLTIESIPKRKTDVRSIEILEQYGRLSAWKETLDNGGYRIYRMNEFEPNRKLVLELIESSYGLTGIWTFELSQIDSSAQVVISEESTLNNIPMRGTRGIFGRDKDLLIWAKYIRIGITESLIRNL